MTAVSFLSAKWPWMSEHSESESEVVRVSAGRYRDERIAGEDDVALTRRLLKELSELIGISAEPSEAHLQRWECSFPQYLPGHGERRRRGETGFVRPSRPFARRDRSRRHRHPGLHLEWRAGGRRGVGRPSRMSSRSAGRGRRVARLVPLPLVGGALVGLSLPPLGWWPLGIAGVALIASALFGERLAGRLAVGLLAGFGQFFISLAWALQFNTAGYVVLAILETVFFVVACAVVPPGRGRLPAAAAALTLAEWARQTWPFGGLPLGGIALGQANGPLAPAARLGGSLLVAGVTFLAGTSLAALAASIVASWVKAAGGADGAGAAPGRVAGPPAAGRLRLGREVRKGLLSAVAGIAVVIALVIAGRTVSHPSAGTTNAGAPR